MVKYKKWTFIIGIIALGFVIFNNVIQTSAIIQDNNNLMIGLFLALIGSVLYGFVNINKIR